jgi:hypothetical protein
MDDAERRAIAETEAAELALASEQDQDPDEGVDVK